MYASIQILASQHIYDVIKVRDKKLLKTLGLKVRAIRESKNFSQETLANLADVPLSQIGRLERGEINPTVSTCFAIAKALDMDLNELFIFPAHKR